MRRLLPFLACLMVVLTGWSGMAHAAEAAGGSLVGLSFTVHAPGDGDESPADADMDVPHHHASCHGHDNGHPATTAPAAFAGDAGERPALSAARALIARADRIPSRPPRA